MKDSELEQILFSLLKNDENECIEYKEANNSFDFEKLGKYFSALSNAANLVGKQYSWLIFGIKDKTHEFVNTKYRNNGNLNKLKKEITKGTNDGITFLDIFELFVEDNKRVIMFKIPAAMGIPTTWRGFAYDRNDEELVPLNQMKSDQIKSTMNFD
ncbi:MAG: helix-turn-helix domain-containing protein [Clostridia bacterium]